MRIRVSSKRIVNFAFVFLFVCGLYRGTAISGFELFSNLNILDKALTFFQYLCYVYVLFAFFKNRKLKPNLWHLLFVLYCGLILLSTVLSGVDIGEAFNKLSIMVITFLWLYIMQNESTYNELELFVKSLNLLQIINFIFMILFYGGMKYANSDTVMGSTGHVYLLGYDNGLIMYALPSVFLNYFLYSATHKIAYKWMMIIVCLPVVLSGSLTGCIAILSVIILYFSKHIYKALKGIKGIVIAVLLFWGLYNLTIQNLFRPLLEYFGKGITMNGRTEIWGWALQYISESPIIGYGYNTDRARTIFFWKIGVSAAHNQILDVLLQSGMIGLILYFAIYYLSIKDSLKKFRLDKSTVAKLQFIIEIVFFFVMIVESYSSYGSYPLLFAVLSFGIGRKAYGKLYYCQPIQS